MLKRGLVKLWEAYVNVWIGMCVHDSNNTSMMFYLAHPVSIYKTRLPILLPILCKWECMVYGELPLIWTLEMPLYRGHFEMYVLVQIHP